jgi:hypothetical protein
MGIPSAEGKRVEASEALKKFCASFCKLGHALLLAIDHWRHLRVQNEFFLTRLRGEKVLLVVP